MKKIILHGGKAVSREPVEEGMIKSNEGTVEKETGTVEGSVWIGIGLIICLLALRFDLGSFHQPGPGFVALLSGLFICGIGWAMVIAGYVEAPPGQGVRNRSSLPIGAWRRLIYTMALLLGYVILIDPVGFILTTFLLMFGLFFTRKKSKLCLEPLLLNCDRAGELFSVRSVASLPAPSGAVPMVVEGYEYT